MGIIYQGSERAGFEHHNLVNSNTQYKMVFANQLI